MPAPTERSRFRLSLLLSPSYLNQRRKQIHSFGDLFLRIKNIFVYSHQLIRARTGEWREAAVQAVRKPLGARRDKILDRELRQSRVRFASRPRAAGGYLPNPPSPVERNPLCRYELSWNTHVSCNFDCSYCWFHGHWEEFAPLNRYVPAADWKRHWARFNAKHGPAKIDIAGGEPFTYPQFLEILEDLGRKNVVVVSTNLSWGVERFIAHVDPDHVEISASFHPEFAGAPEAFLEKITRLRKAGFHANVSLVAYPAFLPRLLEFVDLFLSRGILLDVQPFRGMWEGRLYPQSYTADSKALLEKIIDGAHRGEYYPGLPPERKIHRVEATSLVLEYQLGRKSTRGVACNAGVFYGRLQPHGDVTRCSQGAYVGNFFDENFGFWPQAEPCPFKQCDCVNEIIYIEGGPLGPQ